MISFGSPDIFAGFPFILTCKSNQIIIKFVLGEVHNDIRIRKVYLHNC